VTACGPTADKAGVKLTFLPFITKAVVAALKKHPQLNAAFDEATSEIVERGRYNIGVATSTDAGLMVPVIRDADRKSLLDVAREIARLGEDAKAGKVRSEGPRRLDLHDHLARRPRGAVRHAHPQLPPRSGS
jgi:pyruvate dehydrogenase E2 component (dihydrolipoamide acetyltransferase)